MKKRYSIPGKNYLEIDDSHQGSHFKTLSFNIRGEFMVAPLSKPKVKQLIDDLEKWLEESK